MYFWATIYAKMIARIRFYTLDQLESCTISHHLLVPKPLNPPWFLSCERSTFIDSLSVAVFVRERLDEVTGARSERLTLITFVFSSFTDKILW